MVRQASNNTKQNKAPSGASPVSNVSKIASLNRYPDKDYAHSLLHQVVKLVAPIIHENQFKVGTLCEMYPKNPNLLGLNVNRGQKILIRLRYHSNDRSFYPLGDIIGTFLHELTHNRYGAHDARFYKFLDNLKKRFEDIQYGGFQTTYICEEERLGRGYGRSSGYISMREKRIKELSKPKFKVESRKLGTSSDRIGKTLVPKSPEILRSLILQAAERRLKDAKWCPSDIDVKDVEPINEELDIIIIDDVDNYPTKSYNETSKHIENTNSEQPHKFNVYKEIIDLTSEEYNEPIQQDEIIVIDGCEEGDNAPSPSSESQMAPKSILRLTKHNSVQSDDSMKSTKKVQFFNLLPSFDEVSQPIPPVEIESDHDDQIQYTFSSSPSRTFINEEEKYPRRKLVAALNFDQILKKAEKIEVQERGKENEIEIDADMKIETGTTIIKTKKHSKKKTKTSKKDKHTNRVPSRRKKSRTSAPASERKSKQRSNVLPPVMSEVSKKVVKPINFEDLL